MNIIRDEECGGIMMIPLFVDWHIRRCNVRDCKETPTTIVAGIADDVIVGLCEKHYQQGNKVGVTTFTFDFDNFDAFKEAN